MQLVKSNIQKKAVFAVLIAVIVAMFACPLVVNIPTQATTGPHATDTTHNNPVTHVTHLRDMVLTTQKSMSVIGAILLLVLFLSFVFVLIVSKKRTVSTVSATRIYYRHRPDALFLAKERIFSWLSLFERAPNLVATA